MKSKGACAAQAFHVACLYVKTLSPQNHQTTATGLLISQPARSKGAARATQLATPYALGNTGFAQELRAGWTVRQAYYSMSVTQCKL
jgi:hypothetical protein